MALWVAVAALTLAHTATLVFALGASALSLACAALFAWVALLGVGGALRGLAAAASADAHAGHFADNLRVRHGRRWVEVSALYNCRRPFCSRGLCMWPAKCAVSLLAAVQGKPRRKVSAALGVCCSSSSSVHHRTETHSITSSSSLHLAKPAALSGGP